jgi:hypothetical protein
MGKPLDELVYKELDLLYEQPFVTSQLTADPSAGTLDIQAFIKGKEHCWRALDKTHVDSKKNIILTSGYFHCLADSTKEVFFQCIGDLIDKGFNVYFPTHGSLAKIPNKEAIRLLNSYTPITTAAVRALAAKQGLSNEHTAIFNTKRLFEFLTSIHTQKIDPYAEHLYEYGYPSLSIWLLTTELSKIEGLIEDQDGYLFSLDDQDHPLLPTKIQNHIYEIEVTHLNERNTSLFYILGKHVRNAHFSNSNISSQQLATFLAKSSHLKQISLRECQNLANPPVELSQPILPHLTEIKGEYSDMSVPQLLGLITRAPLLEKLELRHVTTHHDTPFCLLPGQLNHLKQLTTIESFNSHQLAMLLKASPNLQYFFLTSSREFDPSPFGLAPYSLSHLTTLSITDTPLNGAQFGEMINASQSLESIHLNASKKLGESLTLSSSQLSHLKEFHASDISLTPEQILTFLRAPLLEKVCFSDFEHVDETLSKLKPGELSHIKSFDIPTTVSATTLGTLLNAIPNLETLELGGLENLGQSTFDLPQSSLNKLTCINVFLSAVTAEQLSTILNASPNLQTLDITNTSNLGTAALNLTESQLPHLKEMSVNQSSITAQQLTSLLKSAPHLKKINFEGCDKLGDGSCHLSLNSLQDLTEITASDSSINAQQLGDIINASPNLETLQLNKCTHFGQASLNLNPGQLTHLRHLELENASITLSQLENILLAAPQLLTININGCQFLGDAPLKLTKRQLPKLQWISLNHSSMNDHQFLNLIQASPQLETANISSTPFCDYDWLTLKTVELETLKKVRPDELENSIRDLHDKQQEQVTASIPDTGFATTSAPLFSMIGNLGIDGQLRNDPSTTLEVTQLFQGHVVNPQTMDYHLNKTTWTHPGVFMQYIPNSFSLEKVDLPTQASMKALQTDFKTNPIYNKSVYYYGQIDLGSLSPNTWYQLPALSLHDALKSFASNCSDDEIQHDKESGYYYLRVSTPTQNSSVNYIIESTAEPTRHPQPLNPIELDLISGLKFNRDGTLENNSSFRKFSLISKKDKIDALIAFCHFDASSADNIEGQSTEILNALIKGRAGACRHRSMLFTALASELGINASLIENGCHAFVSLFDENNRHITVNLGGAPGQIQEHSMATRLPEQQKATPPTRPKKFTATTAPESVADPIGLHVAITSPVTPLPEPIKITASNPFQTWDNVPLNADNFPNLKEELLKADSAIGRRLVIMEDEAAIEALHEAVIDTESSTFFTQNLDAISTKTLKADEGPYQIIDSPMALFLKDAQAHPEKQKTWFINWSHPKASHVRLNSILDDVGRHLGDIELPPNLHIVVAIDKASATLMGEDFYSRFDVISQAPVLLPTESTIKPITEATVAPEEHDAIITTGAGWQEVLLGTYQINGTNVSFKPGALLQALQHQTTHLKIHNAPWDNADFRGFMTELQKRKEITINGQVYPVLENFNIEFVRPSFQYPKAPQPIPEPPPSPFQQALDWISERPLFSTITRSLQWLVVGTPATTTNTSKEDAKQNIIVNSLTYSYLFPHHHVTQAHGIALTEGFLKTGSTVNLIITETLSEAQWYKIWQTCEQQHVHLSLQCTPSIIPPEGLRHLVTKTDLLTPTRPIALKISNDLDYAGMQQPNALSIPIGRNTRFENLFCHIKRSGENFTMSETPLLRAIRNGQPVLLQGEFSKELAKHLQTLFLEPPTLYVNGKSIPVKGPITLLTKDETPFSVATHEYITYRPENDLAKLKEPLQTELKNLYQILKLTPCHSHFQDLPNDEALIEPWYNNLKTRLALSTGFSTHPEHATTPDEILNYLDTHPFVFLSSETGAGKSYFVERILRQEGEKLDREISIHHGLDAIKNWAKASGDPILFIDEANLSAEHFHIFDNLAHGENTIWIDGESYTLSSKHKIIFAGNPKRYEGRFDPDLFKRFPYYLEFKGQSLENILLPLLSPFESRSQLLKMIETYYRKALDAGINITPRNAQMMCIHAFALKQQPLTMHMPDHFLMQYAILQEIQGLTKDATITTELDATLPQNLRETIEKARQQSMPELKPTDFIWTESRKKIALSIQTLLNIREQKVKERIEQGLGINGLVLEGGPGLGKSRLLIALLKAQDTPYTMISTTNPDTMRHQLLEAFHDGRVVLIDELNSFPDEQFLNALLSGTDLEGNPPKKPGFCLLATQNPIDFQGRQALSKALANRLITLNLEHYTPDELLHILEDKFKLPEAKSSDLISEYSTSRHYAKQQGLFPEPNPRKLFKEAAQKAAARDEQKPSAP